jgi:hypothetical protein
MVSSDRLMPSCWEAGFSSGETLRMSFGVTAESSGCESSGIIGLEVPDELRWPQTALVHG